MSSLEHLSPKTVWQYFEEICRVPRPSKKEEKIISYLLEFARSNNLEAKTDDVGNVLISKPAFKGMENAKTVVLQSHVDMVCEKNEGVKHDFEIDPILPFVDGEWVTAKDTTLGADCGIGMAAQLAVLKDNSIKHGPLECLFTVDEETGLTGANALQPGFISGSILINLDSEDEGEIFIGCAGGIDTSIQLEYAPEPVPAGYFAFRINIAGLLGGHSGDDIDKSRGNANKVLNRFLWTTSQKIDLRISTFNGGNLRNSIAREAYTVIVVPSNQKESLAVLFNHFRDEIENELYLKEPKIKLKLESWDIPDKVIDLKSQFDLLNTIYACPHGVLAMSARMPRMVETSTNLASVKFKESNIIEIITSQRSDLQSGKSDAANMVEAVFKLTNAKIKHGEGYCGWAPNPSSPLLEIAKVSYKQLFNTDPIVRSIHAGLECGLFLEKYPNLDMISIGPTLRGVHSPDERINIATVEKFWIFLVDLLGRIS
jgi:dipeptidase D